MSDWGVKATNHYSQYMPMNLMAKIHKCVFLSWNLPKCGWLQQKCFQVSLLQHSLSTFTPTPAYHVIAFLISSDAIHKWSNDYIYFSLIPIYSTKFIYIYSLHTQTSIMVHLLNYLYIPSSTVKPILKLSNTFSLPYPPHIMLVIYKTEPRMSEYEFKYKNTLGKDGNRVSDVKLCAWVSEDCYFLAWSLELNIYVDTIYVTLSYYKLFIINLNEWLALWFCSLCTFSPF